MIDLRCQDVAAMLESLPSESAALIHADPPWSYSDGSKSVLRGLAGTKYDGLSEAAIAEHLVAAYRVAAADSYLMMWATFPKLLEWARLDSVMLAGGWAYVSGAAWGKTNGLGVGYHFRGDSELLLLYKKGQPKPLGGSKSNLWLADRLEHSEKPQVALEALVRMGAAPGALVVDCYAGESASLALACRRLGRAYIGAELSPKRWRLAMARLSQQEMAWEGVA